MRLALRTLRFRKGGFIATFVAVVFGTAIVMACGSLMETGIRSNVPAERLAAAPIVVTGKQTHLRPGAEDATPLTEQVGVPTSLVAKIRSLDGVTDAVGDLSFPAPSVKGASDGLGHDWASARLAPYRLLSGTPPRRGRRGSRCNHCRPTQCSGRQPGPAASPRQANGVRRAGSRRRTSWAHVLLHR